MKINSPWHRFCAVCVPWAAHSRHSLASGFSEVLTSDFSQNFCASSTFFGVAFPMKTNISVHFFSLRWVDGGGGTGITATNYPALTKPACVG